MSKVEFVSYTGKYPNLCRGVLTVKINGELVSFGNEWSAENGIIPDFPPFWTSGGNMVDSKTNPWKISCWVNLDRSDTYPDDISDMLPEILRVMNENVEHGCCGGCR